MNRRHCLQQMSHSLTAPLLLRTASTAALVGGVGLLSGCAGPQVADYAAQTPTLDLRTYFDGTVDAWGVFTDRSGRVVKRFKVVMDCQWQGDEGVLDEAFTYSDGTQQRRIWKLKALPQGRYEGRADDVVGMAAGVDGTVWHVQFDDWMYLMDEQVMMNKAVMRKWGVTLGEVTLSFKRRLKPIGRVS
jgi:hypothetical protein